MIKVNKFFELLAPLTGAYNNYAKKENINYSTLAIFEYLYNNKKATAADISADWGIAKQTLHSAIKELLKEGIIKYEDKITDKRSKLLSLTEEGMNMAEPVIKRLQVKEEKAFSILTDEEREQFMNLTQKFVQSLVKEVNNG